MVRKNAKCAGIETSSGRGGVPRENESQELGGGREGPEGRQQNVDVGRVQFAGRRRTNCLDQSSESPGLDGPLLLQAPL